MSIVHDRRRHVRVHVRVREWVREGRLTGAIVPGQGGSRCFISQWQRWFEAGLEDEEERGRIGNVREGDLATGVSIREIEACQGRRGSLSGSFDHPAPEERKSRVTFRSRSRDVDPRSSRSRALARSVLRSSTKIKSGAPARDSPILFSRPASLARTASRWQAHLENSGIRARFGVRSARGSAWSFARTTVPPPCTARVPPRLATTSTIDARSLRRINARFSDAIVETRWRRTWEGGDEGGEEDYHDVEREGDGEWSDVQGKVRARVADERARARTRRR